MKKITLIALLCGLLLTLTPGCNGNALTGSKFTLANYDQVTDGMTQGGRADHGSARCNRD
jgi:hypothetical protein